MSDDFENNYYNNNYIDGSNNDENSVNDNTNNYSYNFAGVNSSASYSSEGANTSESTAEGVTAQNENAQNTAYDGNYHYKGSQIPTDESFSGSYNSYNNTDGGYSQNSYSSQSTAQNSYTGNQYGNGTQSYGTPNYGTPYSAQYGAPQTNQQVKTKQRKTKAPKPKKEKKPVTRGAIAVILVVSIVCSAALGFGGGYAATKLFGGGLTVNQSTTSTTDTAATASRTNTGGLSTTDIVNKTADSVVEITTETVTTGNFFQQYVAQGAGSGVIISNDGYILTNNHVIDGANTIKVTLRDSTEYSAKVIGSDSQLDVALLKVDAKDLSPATFGDSSTINVGDYAVVIGNPLGQLGGTVTDGIISALDRDVKVDGETMRLMQTNAAINPGNSGGGLFNANGELIGIICAKASSSTTEVEGLGFAIPINKVLDILNDLKQYGYVQGRIDLGMTLTDVTSNTGYEPGVYVKSVNNGSNAQKAGFQSGDLITKVNGNKVTSVSDINAIIDKLNVGDNVKFSVTRGTQSGDLTLTLEEYNPNKNSLVSNGDDRQSQNGSNSIWDYFNW